MITYHDVPGEFIDTIKTAGKSNEVITGVIIGERAIRGHKYNMLKGKIKLDTGKDLMKTIGRIKILIKGNEVKTIVNRYYPPEQGEHIFIKGVIKQS